MEFLGKEYKFERPVFLYVIILGKESYLKICKLKVELCSSNGKYKHKNTNMQHKKSATQLKKIERLFLNFHTENHVR